MNQDQRRVPASDLDRAMISSLLDKAQRGGQLSSGEHVRRSDAAGRAATRGQLLQLIEDLETETPAFAPASPSRRGFGFSLPDPSRGGPGSTGSGSRGPGANEVPMHGPGSEAYGSPKNLAPTTWTGVPSMREGRSYFKEGATVLGFVAAVAVVIAVVAVMMNDGGGSGSGGDGTEIEAEIYAGTGENAEVPVGRLELSLWSEYLEERDGGTHDFTCDADLPAKLDASVECTVIDQGGEYPATVTVTEVEDGEVTYTAIVEDADADPA